MHWENLLNSVGSLMIVATASTKTMVPLRILAIVANCVLIVFYAAAHEWVPFALQTVALPLNGYRLYQMVVLIRNVRVAVRGSWPSGCSARATFCSPRARKPTRCSAS
jgi:hypothetical protein